MTTKVQYIGSERSVYEAIERMVDRRIRSLVVQFDEKNFDYGVVTARDIVGKVLAQERNPKTVKIGQIASKPLVCIHKDMVLDDAATLMEKSRVARVFVCDDRKIIGVVSMMDIMAAALIMRARGNDVS